MNNHKYRKLYRLYTYYHCPCNKTRPSSIPFLGSRSNPRNSLKFRNNPLNMTKNCSIISSIPNLSINKYKYIITIITSINYNWRLRGPKPNTTTQNHSIFVHCSHRLNNGNFNLQPQSLLSKFTYLYSHNNLNIHIINFYFNYLYPIFIPHLKQNTNYYNLVPSYSFIPRRSTPTHRIYTKMNNYSRINKKQQRNFSYPNGSSSITKLIFLYTSNILNCFNNIPYNKQYKTRMTISKHKHVTNNITTNHNFNLSLTPNPFIYFAQLEV